MSRVVPVVGRSWSMCGRSRASSEYPRAVVRKAEDSICPLVAYLCPSRLQEWAFLRLQGCPRLHAKHDPVPCYLRPVARHMGPPPDAAPAPGQAAVWHSHGAPLPQPDHVLSRSGSVPPKATSPDREWLTEMSNALDERSQVINQLARPLRSPSDRSISHLPGVWAARPTPHAHFHAHECSCHVVWRCAVHLVACRAFITRAACTGGQSLHRMAAAARHYIHRTVLRDGGLARRPRRAVLPVQGRRPTQPVQRNEAAGAAPCAVKC